MSLPVGNHVFTVPGYKYGQVSIAMIHNISSPILHFSRQPTHLSDMELPPGPLYLLRLLPSLVVPSAVVFAIMKVAEREFDISLPAWVIATALLSIHPALFISQRYFSKYRDVKNAAANNAFLPPNVTEQWPYFAGLSMMSQMVQELKDGYPGRFTYIMW